MIPSANYPENAVGAHGDTCATSGFVAIVVV